jgi:hypothetical protein
MRFLLLTIFSALLSSCSMIDTSRIAPGYVQAYGALKQYFSGSENMIDPEIIRNIPYASMLVRIGKGPTALMILESKSDDDYLWVSADGVYLLINNGKIIQTHGLNNNLRERLESSQNWDDNQKFTSYLSFTMPTLNNLKVTSIYKKKGLQEVELMFSSKQLNLIEEEISSEAVGWYRTNKYWVDDSDFVWKSVQSISPKLPEIYIEVTKRPR